MNPTRLLPLSSLAAALGIRPADLRVAAEKGEIPCVRVGTRGVLFDRLIVERELLRRASSGILDRPPVEPEEAPDAAPR